MGVACLGGHNLTTTPATSTTATSTTATSTTVDLEGARWHFEHAQRLLLKLREDHTAALQTQAQERRGDLQVAYRMMCVPWI